MPKIGSERSYTSWSFDWSICFFWEYLEDFGNSLFIEEILWLPNWHIKSRHDPKGGYFPCLITGLSVGVDVYRKQLRALARVTRRGVSHLDVLNFHQHISIPRAISPSSRARGRVTWWTSSLQHDYSGYAIRLRTRIFELTPIYLQFCGPERTTWARGIGYLVTASHGHQKAKLLVLSYTELGTDLKMFPQETWARYSGKDLSETPPI